MLTIIIKKISRFVQGASSWKKGTAANILRLSVFFCGLSVLFPVSSAKAESLIKFPATDPATSQDVMLQAKLYMPQSKGKHPAVVLMHGCGGWQPSVQYSLQSHANYLTKQGYVVLSVDSFGPRHNGGGELCKSNRELRKALNYRTSDAFDALHYLQAQSFVDPENIFLMGQSNGGSVAIIAAKESTEKSYSKGTPGFRAVAAYYPWCGAFESSNVTLSAPLIVFAGGQDDWVPPEQCERARPAGAAYQIEVYADAVHSFDLEVMKQRYNGKMIGYSKSATQDSRAKMLAFFDHNLTSNVRKTHLAMR